jgi:hypothetical protein
MKGEHTWRELESAGNLACRHTLRSGLHQEAKDVETIILRESSERSDGIDLFHISTNIE